MNWAQLRGVSVGYGGPDSVLDGVDLEIGAGLTLVTGPNGSGKSTLAELLAGALTPLRGGVWIMGSAATSAAARAARVVCRSTPALYPTLSVTEHVDLIAIVHPGSVAEVAARVSAYGLSPWTGVPVSDLSTGNLRKAWLVLCTARPAPLVVLDEPYNGLDEHGARVLTAEVQGWITEGRAVIVIAHDPPAQIISLATSVVRVEGGTATARSVRGIG